MLTKTDVPVRVLVLYPTAFTALGVDIKGGDVVLVKESLSVTLLANGWAELVEAEAKPVEEKPAKKASK